MIIINIYEIKYSLRKTYLDYIINTIKINYSLFNFVKIRKILYIVGYVLCLELTMNQCP